MAKTRYVVTAANGIEVDGVTFPLGANVYLTAEQVAAAGLDRSIRLYGGSSDPLPGIIANGVLSGDALILQRAGSSIRLEGASLLATALFLSPLLSMLPPSFVQALVEYGPIKDALDQKLSSDFTGLQYGSDPLDIGLAKPGNAVGDAIANRATTNALLAHTGDNGNPHAVTASQIGTYTRDEIDALLSLVEGGTPDLTLIATKTELSSAVDALKGGVASGLDTLAKIALALAGKQPADADLDAIAGLATTLYGRGFLTLADGPAALAKIGAASAADAALTGAPTAPTAAAGTDSAQLATTAFVAAAVRAILGMAPADLDTLNEIAARIVGGEGTVAALASTVAGKLSKAANLSDLADVAVARESLQLGSAALQAASAFAAAVHGHAIGEVTGLSSALNLKADKTQLATPAYTEFSIGLGNAVIGQTSFPVPAYTPGLVQVIFNGAPLPRAAYTATSGTTIVLLDPFQATDFLAVSSQLASGVANAAAAVHQHTPDAILGLLAYVNAAIDARLASYPTYSGTGPAPVATGLPFLNGGVVQIAS